MEFPFLRAFIALFLYRYFRLVVNLFSFWTFKPIPPPENPKLTAQDVTVILPTLEGCGDELVETIRTILDTQPYELLLVTIEANRQKAENMLSLMPASKSRIRLFTVTHPNKRRQMTRAIPEVRTTITVFADDDVSWPRTVLPWMLAPFEKDERFGGVVTCQRLRRAVSPSFSQRIWGFLGALYLERRNFDCAATTHIDGGLPCMSGRTVAYRTDILQNEGFTYGFTNEEWWFGKYQLNADDDNFITRWMVSHGWETFMQYHPEAEVLTTLEDNPKFLKQCARWSRSNWRSNLTSMFHEKHIWYAHRDGCLCPVMNWPFIHGPYSLPASLVNDAVECKISLHSDYNFPDTTTDLRNWSWKAGSFLVLVTDCGKFLFGHLLQIRQPWSAYAVHLTTLSPPALLGDLLLLILCHKATVSWDNDTHALAMQALGLWMFISKFIKLLGHYIRYPVDVILLPVSILFGYFHGAIKIYAVLTLNVTTWGSRDGADDYDAERMKKRTDTDRVLALLVTEARL
ncbi:nucleotide-diphospho-sugar transferase [Aspergillus welwitschiae]|uniref:Nucleotide-diphospho-sugar transferase n=1 Tax=Aspergillus welwitschiae TaxID=1341132 RepID=A0A3F3Q983_9EURO|nr:nucleotide-diphospho-sugar transferase [Aspergillus welwitschiae]RDH35685.1 nucleotide-diphospho-sugar transferase [Aspergillus welwitschiae]